MLRHITVVLVFVFLARFATAAPVSDAHVLLITLDGFPAYLFNDPQTPVPVLRELASHGAVAEQGMHVVNPTVTWPNHTTLITGVRPSRHGVLFNGMLVRGEPGAPVRVDPFKDQADLVTGPTLFEPLHQAGLVTAAIDWPCTRNAPAIDWNFPDVPEQVKHMTPALRDELVAAGTLAKGTDAAFSKLTGPGHDLVWVDAACRVIRERKPSFMTLHLLNTDSIHHRYGPGTDASMTSLALADKHVGVVLAALKEAGIDRQTTVFVVADHGFATAAKLLRPNALFGAAGLLIASPTGIVQARAMAVPEGGSALVYFTDPPTADQVRAKVLRLLADREGIAAVIEPRDYENLGIPNPKDNRQAPDLVLAAKEGYAFDGSAFGEEWIVPAVLGRGTVGNHGYLADMAKMNALFIASGRGIKPGARPKLVENIDVAPTAAHLLGFEMSSAEGKLIEEILDDK